MNGKKKKQLSDTWLAALFLLLLVSCKKDKDMPPPTAHPVMQYTDLHNLEVIDMNRKYIDVDSDNQSDFFFEVLPVADPLLQRTSFRFYAYSKTHTSLLNADPDQTPALDAGAVIGASFPGYSWWEISGAVLAKEVTPANGNPYWEGTWKNAVRKYLPVRLARQGKHFFGWIEMTLDHSTKKLILHKAALSTEARKEVKAGR